MQESKKLGDAISCPYLLFVAYSSFPHSGLSSPLPYANWARILARWDCRFSRVNSFAQLLDDPQVVANDCIIEWDDPKLGPMKVVGFPVELTEIPLSLRSAAPEIGEHTKALLAEICGYSPEQIYELKNRGIVAL